MQFILMAVTFVTGEGEEINKKGPIRRSKRWPAEW
jgi:hypothetical protein